MNKLNIIKMDGLGNDFIIIDNRIEETTLTKDQIIPEKQFAPVF